MYKIKVATVTDHAESETVEEAMNIAAGFMRTSPDAVALVMDGGNDEAVTVLHNNWAYLATEKP